MSMRIDPSYPIWDDNTLTTTVAATGGALYTALTIPSHAYYIIFSVTTNGKSIRIRDDAATTANAGIYLEQGEPGPANYGIHIAPGTVLNVTHDDGTAWDYTIFLNKIA